MNSWITNLLTCNLLSHPQTSTRFQDPGCCAVYKEEGVVVAEWGRILPALPTLSKLLQEASDDSQRCPGAVTTLQPQTEEEKSAQITPGRLNHFMKIPLFYIPNYCSLFY